MFKIISLMLVLLLQSSCFVFVPFIKQDGLSSNLNRQGRYHRELSPCLLNQQKRPSKIQIALLNLNHSRDAVRTTAVTELGVIAHGRPGVVKLLREATWRDPSKWVRRAAVKAVYKLEGKKSYPTLRNALKDKDPWVVHSAKNLLNK